MQKITFGRLGWDVSVVGLGGGGPSRLGTRYDASMKQAADVVRAAIDQGVTFIDTARGYGTEAAVGQARADRPGVALHIATKVSPVTQDGFRTLEQIRGELDTSLRELKGPINLYQMHGVLPEHYPHVREHIVPSLLKWKEAGLIGALGITERFESDRTHQMLNQAIEDDCWDSVMVGYNMLNPSAAKHILPRCAERGIATLIMFAVRRVFSQPERAAQVISEMIENGTLTDHRISTDAPFDFLLGSQEPHAPVTIPESAYRFCRHTHGADVILTGTGSVNHLTENIASIQAPPLPASLFEQLSDYFGHVDNVTGG